MTSLRTILFAAVLAPIASLAQPCDPSIAPSGLSSTYTPGTGAILNWTPIPGSVAIRLQANLPGGASITKNLFGLEVAAFVIPDGALSLGTYQWRIQAACTTTPPYNVTPISAADNFTVGGGSTCPATVIDVDGNVYNTVQIGSQCWMQENLKVEHFRNGDTIPSGLSNSDWSLTTSGASAVYDELPANKGIYGLLYNWFAVSDARGLCPTGWHEPSDGEWTQLTDFLGGGESGGSMKTTGTLDAGTGLWLSPNSGATNSSGFSGLPGGYRNSVGTCNGLGRNAHWWSASESSTADAWKRRLGYGGTTVDRSDNSKEIGRSVRCVQD